MKFREYLNESTIKEILSKDNIFIMIIGGAGSGKNHIYRKYFSHLPLFDVDEYILKLSGGDPQKAGKFVSQAIKELESDLKNNLMKRNSVVTMGTGKSVHGVQNKFKFARDAGKEIAIIRVDVAPKVAFERSQARAQKEQRAEIPLYNIEKTNKMAKLNFRSFAKLADYSLIIKN